MVIKTAVFSWLYQPKGANLHPCCQQPQCTKISFSILLGYNFVYSVQHFFLHFSYVNFRYFIFSLFEINVGAEVEEIKHTSPYLQEQNTTTIHTQVIIHPHETVSYILSWRV